MQIAQKFTDNMGKPNPEEDRGFSFEGNPLAFFWDELYDKIRAGWFMNRFLYLFGEGVRDLDICLKHWSFLLPNDNLDRWVIGRNAYGALIVIEEPLKFSDAAKIGILDPLTVSYRTNPNMTFTNLISHWLPENKLQAFMNESIYKAWQEEINDYLLKDQILAMKIPLSLNGKMEIDNFAVENIYDYYKTTGGIYKNLPVKQFDSGMG